MVIKNKGSAFSQPGNNLHMHWRAGLLALVTGGFTAGLSGFIFVRECSQGMQIIPWELTPFMLTVIVVMGWGRGISACRDNGRIRCWHGVILPGLPPLAFYWKCYDASGMVSVACYGVQTGTITSIRERDEIGASYECYIDVETADGKLKTLAGTSDPANAHRAAKRLALFLRLPLTVQAHRGELHLGPGRMTRIQPEELTLRWVDRMRRQFPEGAPDPPSPMGRLSLETDQANKRLLLPRGRLRREYPLLAGIGLASAAGACGSLLQGIASPWFGFGIFLALSASALLTSSLLMFILWLVRPKLKFAPGTVAFRWPAAWFCYAIPNNVAPMRPR